MSAIAADLRMLRRLLTEEQAALQGGALTRLPQVAQHKAALVDRLARSAPQVAARDRPALADVLRLARRNSDLFDAALAGLRDAQTLLAQIRQPPALETYARDGSRQVLEQPARNLERRA